MTSSKDIPVVLSGQKRGDDDELDLGGLTPTVVFSDIFQSKNVLDINHAVWDERVFGQKLTLSGVIGIFSIGEQVRAPNGEKDLLAIGTINSKGFSGGILNIDGQISYFIPGQTVTGQSSGATGIIDSVGGTSIDFNYNLASAVSTIGMDIGDKIIRQTRRYFAYGTGHTRAAILSILPAEPKSGLRQRAGAFDENDGFFAEISDFNQRFVLRSSVGGTPVDDIIDISEWNIDKLDGKGPSGKILTPGSVITASIIYDWQGSGFVYYGFFIEGVNYLCHRIGTEASGQAFLCRTPSLPIRYEIENITAQAEESVALEMGSTIRTSSTIRPNGFQFNASMGVTYRPVVMGSMTPVFAIRLKNQFNGHDNRKTIELIGATFTAKIAEANICLALVHDAVDITATWISAHPDSGVEYSTDISALIPRPLYDMASAIATDLSGMLGTVAEFTDFRTENHHSFLSQGIDSQNSEMFVFYGESGDMGGSQVRGTVSWNETD